MSSEEEWEPEQRTATVEAAEAVVSKGGSEGLTLSQAAGSAEAARSIRSAFMRMVGRHNSLDCWDWCPFPPGTVVVAIWRQDHWHWTLTWLQGEPVSLAARAAAPSSFSSQQQEALSRIAHAPAEGIALPEVEAWGLALLADLHNHFACPSDCPVPSHLLIGGEVVDGELRWWTEPRAL